MMGGVVRSVLFYWIFLLVALVVAKLMNMPQDNASVTKLVALVTVIYFGFSFIRQAINRKK